MAFIRNTRVSHQPCAVVVAILGALLCTAPAQGGQQPAAPAPDDPTQRAKTLFTEGQREYNLAHYTEALPLFEGAYKLKPLPELLYNIAQCHRQLGHLDLARRLFQNFVDQAPESPSAKVAREKLAELDAAIKAQALAQSSQPTALAGAEAAAPAQPKTPPPASAKPAAPTAAQAPVGAVGPPPASGTQATGSQRSAAPAQAVSLPPAKVAEATSGSLRVAGYGLVGVSVAAAGAGAFFGLGAKAAANDSAGATTPAAWQTANDDAQSKAKLATISWVAAGALAAAGITLLLLDR